jgi:hypothetical protein
MSKLKANLNPRFTDSTTAQVSTSVKKSFKRFFSRDSVDPSPNAPDAQTPTTSSNLSQKIEESRAKANEFHSLAATLSQSMSTSNSGKSSPTQDPSEDNLPPKQRTLSLKLRGDASNGTSAKVQSDTEKNEKIRQAVMKVNQKATKKWNKLIKKVEKQCTSELKRLEKDIILFKRKEKAQLMGQNAEVNANTAARSTALSAETTNQILASREARVDREVEKKAEKRRDDGAQRIAQSKRTLMETGTEKLYHKTITKQIAEFQKLRSKYLI